MCERGCSQGEEGSPKKGHSLLREAKDVELSFIDQYQGVLTQVELCALLEVSDRGYRALRARPISRRQRDDMVTLAHIREHHRLLMESYWRPRMNE